MMDEQAFRVAYGASRNGANNFVRNPMYPKFLYSDGVQECAVAGCYWLLDILGTELPLEFARRKELMCFVRVEVSGSKAQIAAQFGDVDEAPWRQSIEWTDMPEGLWELYVVDEGPDEGYRCILPSEY